VQAAVRCAERGIARFLLLAAPDAIGATLRTLGLTLPAGVDVLDPGRGPGTATSTGSSHCARTGA
jgi:phosphate acetyltransferase